MKNKKNRKWLILMICFAVVTGATALLVYTITSQKHTLTTTGGADEKLEVLSCSSMMKSPEKAFFSSKQATSTKHVVKIALVEGKPGKISYEYSGTFGSEEEAKNAEATLHAKFNLYMGTYVDTLSRTFNYNGNEMTATVFADAGKMSNISAKVFLLEEQEGIDFYSYTEKELMTIYAARGLTCEKKG